MLTPSMRARTMRPGTTPLGIVEHGADRDGARRVVDARRDELDRAHGSRSTRPARPRCSRRRCPPCVGRKRGAHEVGIGVGDGEIDVQTIRLHDVRQQARIAAGRDEAAFGTHLAARQPGDRRANLRVRQLELGRAQRGTRRRRRRPRRSRTPRARYRDRARSRASALVKRQDAVALAARLTEVGFLDAERSAAPARPRRETDPDRCGTAPRRPRRARLRRSGARAECPRRAREPRPRARL